MPRDLASHLLTLYTSPLPFFPVNACPHFYSLQYTLYSEIFLFPPPNTNSLPPFLIPSLSLLHIDWIADLHLQGTLSDFTPEKIYLFSNILFALL
jgi:hypothetical protein